MLYSSSSTSMLPCIVLSLLLSVQALDAPYQKPLADFCSWSPLQSRSDKLSCRAWSDRGQTVHAADSSKPSDGRHSESLNSWDGPHHCLGDFCVFSNRHFAKGITLVTTIENSRKVAQMQPAESGKRSASPSPYYIAEIPGKGLGVVANRTIQRGEQIMADPPTMIVHHEVLEDMLEEPEQVRLFDFAVQKLPAARRRAVMRQMGDGISHILFTNSFQMDLGGSDGEGYHFGDFPEVSRFNHDCRPNLAFYIDANLTHQTHAVRDIQPGEELTISYINPFDARTARQSHLHSAWGFRCVCAQCSLPAPRATASDENLATIAQLETELGDFASASASPAMVDRLLRLYEEERLHAKMAGAYTVAALNYALFGAEKKARKYAELAAEAVTLEFGPDANDVVAMRELAKDPRGHWSWRKRKLG